MSNKRKLPPTSEENDDETTGLTTPPPKKKKILIKSSVEDDLICPITLQLPIHPAVAGDGRVYECSALKTYIRKNWHPRAGIKHVKSPITREDMAITYAESPSIKNHIETLINNGCITGELAETWTKANYLITKAKNGNAKAMRRITKRYYYGSMGFPEDNTQCFHWAKKSHEAGCIYGTGWFGMLLLKGIGCFPNKSLGLLYLGMAAQGGDDISAYRLGKSLAQGWFELDINYPEAIKWLKVALSGECKYKHMSENKKQEAQKLLDEISGAGSK